MATLPFDLIDKKTEGILKYGDVVSFFMDPSVSFLKSDGEFCSEAATEGGFLTAEGLVDGNISLEQLYSTDKPGEILPPAGFRDCLFRLWPPFTYSMQEEYLHYVNQQKEEKAQHFGDPMFNKDAFDEHEAQLLSQKTAEQKQNNDELKSSFGTAIKYGDLLQFEHVKSGKFVTLFPRLVSDKDPSCLSVKLNQDGNENSWIVILPHLQHRSIGACVEVGDQLSIRFKTQEQGQLNATLGKTIGRIKDVNLSVNHNMAWKVLRYQDAPTADVALKLTAEKTGLRVGQMVTLKFPQAKSYLTASAEMFGHAKVYFRPLNIATSTMSNSALDSSSNIIWVVQRELSHFGRYADWDMTFFLRHFNTGYYLSFDDKEESLFMSKDRKHALHVRLARTSNKRKQEIIQDKSTLYIGNKKVGNKKVGGWVCMSEKDFTQVVYNTDREIIHEASFVLDALKDEEVIDVEYCLMISRRLGEMAKGFATKINTDIEDWSKVSSEIAGGYDMRNLLSLCVDYCVRLVTFLATDDAVYETITNEYPDFLQRARHFMTYINETAAASEARQVLMREQGLFYHCFSILISVGDGLDKIEKAEGKKHTRHSNALRCIGLLLYSTIKLGCKSNRENESYVAKLEVTDALISSKKKNTVMIMLEHLDLGIGAPQTLSALIDNNKKLLEEEINDERLDEFCNAISLRGLHPVYLDIFAAVCGYQGESLPKKQIAVARKLFSQTTYNTTKLFFDTVVLNASIALEEFPELLANYGSKDSALYGALFVHARSHDGTRLDPVPNVQDDYVVHEVPKEPGIKFLVPINIVNVPVNASSDVPKGTVNMRTYWQAAEERENQNPVGLKLCDNEGGGAYELFVVGHKLDSGFMLVSMPTFQELYTWYELEGVNHFVYPCELEENSPGCAQFLKEFKVPKGGEEVTYNNNGELMKKKITAVHRAWVRCKLSKGKERVIAAAVPLRLLQHLGTKSPRMCEKNINPRKDRAADLRKPPERVTQYMQQYYQYYLAQLNLFREITYNRNYFGIERIQQMLDLKEVLSGMNMVHQPQVRRHFCELMMSVYVDAKNQQALKIPFNARPWKTVDDNDVLPSCRDDAQFAMLQAFVEQYLEAKNANPGWIDKESTQLTISVLKLCDLLFNFGFYSSTREIARVKTSLLNGMDPKTDKMCLKMSNQMSKYLQKHSVLHDTGDESKQPESAENEEGKANSFISSMKDGINGVPYSFVILIATFVSSALGITELIFVSDDWTTDNLIHFEDACKIDHFGCPSAVALRILTLLCTIVFVFDVITRLSLEGCKDYFLAIESVIDIFVTTIDVIFVVIDWFQMTGGASNVFFEIIVLLRLVRIARVVTTTLNKKKKEKQIELANNVLVRPDVNDFFRHRAPDVENETKVMLTKPDLMAKFSKTVDPRYSPRGKGDLVFQVKNLQVKLLTRVQHLGSEYHLLQLLMNMKLLLEPDGSEPPDPETVYPQLTKLFHTSWQDYDHKSAPASQIKESLAQSTTNLQNLQEYLLDLVLFTDKHLVESSLNLLLLSSRTKKNLVFLAKTTNLLVGSDLWSKYEDIRDLRLECQTVMDSFENWGFINRGGEEAFFEKIRFLDERFYKMAKLNSLEGTELQIALIDEGIINLLRGIIDIPNRYRGIGYTKFHENNQDSFYISQDIKDDAEEYARLVNDIELYLLHLFTSLNQMLLSLLGQGRKSEQNKKVQAKIFGLINDLLPWVGTVDLTEQVIIHAISGNAALCNAIDDTFIKACAMQFNDQDKLPKRKLVPIMLIISKISFQPDPIIYLPRNQKRLVSELCKTKERKEFLASQVEQSYNTPASVDSKWIEQREELLHMVAHLCVGEINITEAKMLELVYFGRVLSAVLVKGRTWKTKLCFLDLFYHMVVDAELKIDAVGQHPDLSELLSLFATELAVLCGWVHDDNYPQFKEGELLKILNENPDIFDGDIFEPYHPSFSTRGAMADVSNPIVLIRYSVHFVARICKRLFNRYGEDLANLNSTAIRDITYCAEYLRHTLNPGKFNGTNFVGDAVLKFCLTMEELHLATKFITSGYRGGKYIAKFEAVLKQHEHGYSKDDFDIFCIPRALWTTYSKDLPKKKVKKAKVKVAKIAPTSESKSESKSDRKETAYRKQVAAKLKPFIQMVRDNKMLKKLQAEESNNLLKSLMKTLKTRGDEKSEEKGAANVHGALHEKLPEKIDDVKNLPNFIYCVVQHLRNALKPTRELGRRQIFLSSYTDETTLLYSIKLFTTLLELLRTDIEQHQEYFDLSSSNVIDGLVECEILEFCFEMMPHGVSRKFRVRNNTLKLLRDFLKWAFDCNQMQRLQDRSIEVFAQPGDAMSRNTSFFFGVEDIFARATQHIKNEDFDDKRSNFLTELDSVCDILKFLLDGQHLGMQEMMLGQPQLGAVEDVSILYLATNFLKSASRQLIGNSKNTFLRTALHIIVKVMEVIMEAVQGPCTKNQDFIHRSSFLGTVNRILRRFSADFNDKDENQKKEEENPLIITAMRIKLQQVVFSTLIAMLEGRQGNEMQLTIIEKFGIENIKIAIGNHITRTKNKQNLGKYFTAEEMKYLSREKPKGKPKPIFNPSKEDADKEYKPIYANASELQQAMKECAETAGILWMKLKAADEDMLRRRLKNYYFEKSTQHEAFESWIDETMKTVEVVWKSREGDLLLQEPFPVPELAYLTNTGTFNEMLNTSGADQNDNNNLTHFLDYVEVLYQEVDWERQVHAVPIVHHCCKTDLMNIIYKVFLWISILVLLLILVSYQRDLDVVSDYSSYKRTFQYGQGIKAFRCEFTHYTWWLQDICPFISGLCITLAVLSVIVLAMQLLLNAKPLYHKKKKNMLKTLVFSAIGYAVVRCVFIIFIVVLEVPEFIIIVLFAEYLKRESAQTVIKSISDPKWELITTFVLIFAVILLFSVWVFQFFHKEFSDNYLVCETLLTCFLECINYGMRNGGGVGDSLYPHDFEWHLEHWTFRTFMDLFFFLIINIILLNVVFGIIIDKFGDFRDKAFDRKNTMDNTCFICGQDRAELSLHVDYSDHVEMQHKVENYWLFILYIKEKQSKRHKMTGLQQYVIQLVDSSQSEDWFPIGQSIATKKAAECTPEIEAE